MREYYWCEYCQEEIIPERVTYEDVHDHCGYPVVWKKGFNIREAVEFINNSEIDGVLKAELVRGIALDGDLHEYLNIEFEEFFLDGEDQEEKMAQIVKEINELLEKELTK